MGRGCGGATTTRMHPVPDPFNIIIANVRATHPDLSGTELRVKLREAHAEYVRWVLDTSK